MGLRIIDRHKKPTVEVSEDQKAKELEHAVIDWLEARGGGAPQSAHQEFLEHFSRAKSRISLSADSESMLQMARKVKDSISQKNFHGITSHSKVDIATLLELL